MLDTLVVLLSLTLPATSANPADSIQGACAVGQPTSDIKWLNLYGASTSGGAFRFLERYDVDGLEGQPFSLVSRQAGWKGGNFYVTVSDTAGNESCATQTIFVGSITGVEPIPEIPREERWFDVHGRRVRHPTSRGVYWFQERVAGVWSKPKKRVILR